MSKRLGLALAFCACALLVAVPGTPGGGVCNDGDGDGYGSPGDPSCPFGSETDCDDSDSDVFPGKVITDADVEDGKDNDCNGFEECYLDADDDAFGASGQYSDDLLGNGCDSIPSDGNNESSSSTDCNDADSDVYPGNPITAAHIENGVDNDCDGAGRDECYLDGDADGFGASTPVQDDGDGVCETNDNESTNSTDCKDNDSDVWPGKPLDDEDVGDGDDNDCNGFAECFFDFDGDAFGVSGQYMDDQAGDGCNVGANESGVSTDCDDADSDVYPGKPLDDEDVGDGDDNDCNGFAECFLDGDDDAYGASGQYVDDLLGNGCDSVASDGNNESSFSTDCADGNSNIHPGKVVTDADVEDGTDIDCNGFDECYLDGDDDAYGVSGQYSDDLFGNGCDSVPGDGNDESSLNTDCNDADSDVFPFNPPTAAHVGNGFDNDCDSLEECFLDGDGDGFGVSTIVDDDGDNVCEAADNESTVSTDCRDDRADIYPNAPLDPADLEDGEDDDCDGAGLDECYLDADGDGFGVSTFVQDDGDGVCETADNESLNTTDCRDDRSDIYPGAPIDGADVDDGEDDDCDGANRDECWLDLDADGYGDSIPIQDDGDEMCLVANNESLTSDDCNDGVAAINPAATEICDGVDNDCDGSIDEDVGAGGTLTLDEDTVVDMETYESCGTIVVGPNYHVAGPAGSLLLKAAVVILGNDCSVGFDGTLTIENTPP